MNSAVRDPVSGSSLDITSKKLRGPLYRLQLYGLQRVGRDAAELGNRGGLDTRQESTYCRIIGGCCGCQMGGSAAYGGPIQNRGKLPFGTLATAQ